jgi:hypothetical protein
MEENPRVTFATSFATFLLQVLAFLKEIGTPPEPPNVLSAKKSAYNKPQVNRFAF